MAENTIKERIRIYAQKTELSDRAFEMQTGMAQGSLRLATEPASKAIVGVLKAFPEVSPDWLLMGVGPMERVPNNYKKIEKAETKKEIDVTGMVTIPASVLQLLQQQLINKDDQIAALLSKIEDK